MMRFAAVFACLGMALDSFKNTGALGLPQWAWAVVGLGWIVNAIYIAIKGTDA
jgi:hypothetical protein